MTIDRFNNTVLFVAILCSVHFFGLYYNFGAKLNVLIDLIFILCVFLFFYTNKKMGTVSQVNSKILTLYIKYFYLFLIFLFISTISCLYFHDQNMLRTIQAMRTFLYFIIFFMLIKSSIPKDKLETVCYIFLFCYCIVFSLQLAVFPTEIVPLGRADEFDRGFLRLRLEGVGFVTLVGMLSLNKYLSTKRLKHIVVLAICFIFIYLLGFRTLLLTYLLSLMLLVYFFYKNLSLAILINCLVIGLGILLYQSGIGVDFLEENIELTSNQLEDFDDYIRVLTYRFLFEDTSPSQFALLFGNGFPYLGSQYGYDVLYVGTELNGFIAADLGLLGFAFYFGGITTFIYILMLITPMFKRFKKESVYLKVYGFYLVISSFTTAESFRIGIFGVICIYLYLVVLEAGSNAEPLNKASN